MQWPQEVSVFKLRQFILLSLGEYGSPLRWAITSLDVSSFSKDKRQIKIEAAVITKGGPSNET